MPYGQAVIPDDFTGEFCCYSVLWPNSPQWLAILRGVLIMPIEGRFWDANTGVINDAREQIYPTLDNNLHLQESIMSCTDAQQGFTAIANAIVQAAQINKNASSSGGCGCNVETIINVNGGVQGSITQEGTGEIVPIYGEQTPIEIPFGEIPPGFENKEEWDLNRCQVANGLVDGAIATLRAWASINFGQTVGLAGLVIAAVVGLITFPPATIAVLIGCLMIMAGVTGLFAATAQEIEDNRADWICALMQGDNVPNIIANIADLADVVISALGTTSVTGAAVKTALLLIFNSDNLNKLMEKTAAYVYPEADCSDCICPLFSPDPAIEAVKAGTEIIEQTLTSISVEGGGYIPYTRYDLGVTINGTSFGEWCGSNMMVTEWELLSGSISDGGDPGFNELWIVYDNEGVAVYEEPTPPELPICGAYFQTVSKVPASWRITIEPCLA